MQSEIDVLIVGAGPVGLTMATELRRHGVTSLRLIDKASERSAHSKALVLWPRTLELLHIADADAPFIDAGMKAVAADIFAGRHRLARARFDRVDSAYPFALIIPQSETERLLEAHLGRLGGAIERRCELVDFTQDADGVTARLRHEAGGEEAVRTRWLVGCDGAHSTVRHVLGLHFEGVTEAFAFILADLDLAGPVSSDELSLFWHPAGLLAIFPIAPHHFRIVADLGVHSEPPRADPTLEEIRAILDRRGPGGIVARDPVWLSHFHINERKVGDYRAGRVFVAGDAAHIHSPAGGQGMNTGMQDACNLAWKLALACRGAARPALIDSYSRERSAVGAQVLRNATALTRMATLRHPLAQRLRNGAVWLLAHATGFPDRLAATLTELAIAYPKSPLSRRAPGAPAGGPRPGERAPDAPLAAPAGDAARLYDRLGRTRFTLVATAPGAMPETRHLRQKEHLDTALVAPGRYRDDALYLVRPDGYVGLVARRAEPDAIDAYLGNFLNAS